MFFDLTNRPRSKCFILVKCAANFRQLYIKSTAIRNMANVRSTTKTLVNICICSLSLYFKQPESELYKIGILVASESCSSKRT